MRCYSSEELKELLNKLMLMSGKKDHSNVEVERFSEVRSPVCAGGPQGHHGLELSQPVPWPNYGKVRLGIWWTRWLCFWAQRVELLGSVQGTQPTVTRPREVSEAGPALVTAVPPPKVLRKSCHHVFIQCIREEMTQ